MAAEDLKKLIREIPDYPKPGILFYDITTLIKDRAGFARVVDYMTSPYLDQNVDLVLGMEARGFNSAPAHCVRTHRGIYPAARAEEATGRDREPHLRSRVRHRYAGDSQGRDS